MTHRYMHSYIHTFMHTFLHPSIYANKQTYIDIVCLYLSIHIKTHLTHTYIRHTCLPTCILTQIHICTQTQACSPHACSPTYIHTYTYTNTCTLHVCLHMCILHIHTNSCMSAFLHFYLSVKIYTYRHVHITNTKHVCLHANIQNILMYVGRQPNITV